MDYPLQKPHEWVTLSARQHLLLGELDKAKEFSLQLSTSMIQSLILGGYCAVEAKTENNVGLYITVRVHPGIVAKE